MIALPGLGLLLHVCNTKRCRASASLQKPKHSKHSSNLHHVYIFDRYSTTSFDSPRDAGRASPYCYTRYMGRGIVDLLIKSPKNNNNLPGIFEGVWGGGGRSTKGRQGEAVLEKKQKQQQTNKRISRSYLLFFFALPGCEGQYLPVGC